MILGVYWYFKFPEDLYHFKFFNFFKGYGGHADNDAELIARVQVDHIEEVISKLETLKTQFKRTYLQLSSSENQLIISLGDHFLFDYYFQLAQEIEKLLILEKAIPLDSNVPFKAISNMLYRPEKETFESIEHRFIQMVGSNFKKHNAENYSIRIDCNLPLYDKKNLISDLTQICREENLHVFYYHDCDFKDHCNLMLLFTNGRQQNDSVQQVHINTFGSKIRQLTEKYLQLNFGHLEGLTYYPRNGPHVELMVDEEYIIAP
ncbi:hypothetical protein [Chryseobacterium sp. JK1]|uniref:hypothetical protein n=1 Tax=Chryseobacterium sp. JK1 TaxID=874294 RepID=UPI003D690B39